MSLTSTRDERVTVVTISSSPKAPKPLNFTWKWSLICQLLYTLSFNPERLMTQNMEKELLNFNNALGFIASGIACIRVKWPRSTYQVSFTVLLKVESTTAKDVM
ncbi:hypothetical protein NFI96_019567 [Prochilodus magdalenae]|nr:hypothetical protein NFI96_019567 [Prochilodus magdalenae]